VADVTCSVEPCSNASFARGWCRPHYNVWHATGSLDLTKKCRDCDARIARSRTSKTRCESCDRAALKRRRKAEWARQSSSAPATYACQDCQAETPRRSPHSHPKRCDECRKGEAKRAARSFVEEKSAATRAHFAAHGRPSVCGCCGGTIANRMTGELRRTCDKCRAAGLKAPFVASPSKSRDFNCEDCGAVFSTLAYGGVPTRCMPCRVKSQRARLRRYKYIRRARQQSAEAERFPCQEIYERDRWRCGICGKQIDQALTYPDPQSVSLDHIVPVSQGGEHTRANVRASHLLCNFRRGARGGNEQLMLIG
jgi:hypothetical protein